MASYAPPAREQCTGNAASAVDASLLLERWEIHRQLRFQNVVRRYISQILYGCKNASCTTPTCASCSKRCTTRPYRTPTQLTARALAHYLASQDNGYEGLCPHPLNVNPHDIEIRTDGTGAAQLSQSHDHGDSGDVSKRLRERRQTKIDVLSLGQNLFNTITLTRSIVMPIRSCTLDTKDLNDAKEGLGRGRDVALHSTPSSTGSWGEHMPEANNGSKPGTPSIRLLNCDTMELLMQELLAQGPVRSYRGLGRDEETNSTERFVYRTVFSVFSNPESLLRSFHETNDVTFRNSPLPHLNSVRLAVAFRDLARYTESLLFDSLWVAVGALFTPPPPERGSPKTLPPIHSRSEPTSNRYLTNDEAAHIILVCIHALSALVPAGSPPIWAHLRNLRSSGNIVPDALALPDIYAHDDTWIDIVDALEYEPALRLADRLVRAVEARQSFEGTAATTNCCERKSPRGLSDIIISHLVETERLAIAANPIPEKNPTTWADPGWTLTATFLEWLRTLVLKNWDGKTEINKSSTAGSSILWMDSLYRRCTDLRLLPQMFSVRYLYERLSPVTEPAAFTQRVPHPNSFHIFEYPCLAPPGTMVPFFRMMNWTTMYEDYARRQQILKLQDTLFPFTTRQFDDRATRLLGRTLSPGFLLHVSREHAFQDTIDQLRGRERRILLKRLKVRLGAEIGDDQGGVTYEFFRVVLQDALRSEFGMFTTNEAGMTWFRPASPQPEWMFEMLGLIFSLAVYNGVTLPVTFPLALYRFILDNDTSLFNQDESCLLHLIRDGWPEVTNSLKKYLEWDQGDVADWSTSYTFNFDAFGEQIEVDMDGFGSYPIEGQILWPAAYEEKASEVVRGQFGLRWERGTPLPPAHHPAWQTPLGRDAEPPLVNNDNRHQFVKDKIFWLTVRSVAPQLEAFVKGFRTCLQPMSLQLFTAESLKELVEGTQTISVEDLKATTQYKGGYHRDHPTIRDFWSIVESYSSEERRRLFLFVTASERVPITGLEELHMTIERREGDSDFLPTSSTCVRTLRLYEYGNKEKMKMKLDLALQNSEGFGLV